MNRFLSKKSAGAESGAHPGSKETRKWKKAGGKKSQEEPKQDFDLSFALPSTDDFRTSLIMPNLSARFSMLREQDDPNSKLGKASDDSVLSPRRKSKPLDFSFALTNNLGDIAEDQSIKAPTQRPGLAHYDSFASDNSSATGTEAATGSIMNRARPIEDGCNLFSQRNYKVAASASTRNLGRALYDDDISTPASQRYKNIEEEPIARGSHDGDSTSESGSLPFGLASSAAEMSVTSPPREQEPLQWSSPVEPKRQASAASSNASDNGMDTISTPATSLASQQLYSPLRTQAAPKPIMSSLTSTTPLERSATKRRMYEQGLDQNMQEQQASALTRLNTIQRQRTISGNKSPNLGSSQTSGSFSHERPAHVLTTFDSINRGQSPLSSPTGSHPQSPSFFASNDFDQNDILSSTVKPSDRGKATAMGAFHMPHQPYDEEQYVRRLQQLHSNNHGFLEGRSSEPASKVTSPNLSRLNSSEESAIHGAARSKSVPTDDDDVPQSTPFSVFQKAAAQMRAQHDDSNPSSPSEAVLDTNRTFFGDTSASDDDDEDENDRRGYLGSAAGRFKPTELENIQEDPLGLAANSRSTDAELDQSLRAPSSRADDPPKALGGLIHQHLRNTSNVSSAASVNQSAHHMRQPSDQSSIYATTIGRDDSVPNLHDHSRFGSRVYGGHNRMDNDYTHSNPWDLDELDDKSSNATSMFTQQSTTASSQQDQRTLASVTSRAPTEVTSQRSSDVSNWHPEHKREVSNGTLEEREAFAQELAARQKAIQESMKAIVETDTRGNSPQQAQSATFKGFGILKHKASGDMSPKLDAQGNKAMKVLGLGAGGSSTSLSSMRKPSYASDENRLPERKQSAAASAPGSARASPRLPSSQRTPPLGDQKVRGFYDMQRPRMDSDMVRHGDGPIARPSPPIGGPSGPMAQPRSNSGSSSAGMPYRGERLYSNGGENTSRSGSIRPNMSPKISQDALPGSARGSGHNTPRQSPALVQKPMAPIEQSRPRGNSKSAGSSPTETRSPAPPPMPNGLRLTPSSSLPGPLNVAFKSGAASSQNGPRPAPLNFQSSPVVGPLSPTSNGPPTPSTIGSQTYVPTTKQFGGMLRKKPVQKSEISEPVLISSTSNVDTVDLPPGASLKNGIELPVAHNPPMNSRFKRTLKLFDFGKENKDDASEPPAAHSPVDRYFNPGAPPPVPADFHPPRKTSLEHLDDFGVQQSYRGADHRPELRQMRSEESLPGSNFGMQSMAQRQLMAQAGMF